MMKTSAEALMEKGFAKGQLIGRQRMLLRLLRIKFGRVSKKRQALIAQTEDISQLDMWLERIVTAKNWEEMELD